MSPGERGAVRRIVVSPVNPGKVVRRLGASPDGLGNGSPRSTSGRDELNGNTGLGRQVSLGGVDNDNRTGLGNGPGTSWGGILGRTDAARLGVDLNALCWRNRSDANLPIARAVLHCPCLGLGDGGVLFGRPVKPRGSRVPAGGEHNEGRCRDLHFELAGSKTKQRVSRRMKEGGCEKRNSER